MSRVEAAAAMDRLPWLPDEPRTKPAKRRGHSVAGWAMAALVVAAGAGYWMGANSFKDETVPLVRHSPSTTTVRLPEPRSAQAPVLRIAPQPEVISAPAPQVHLSRVPEVHVAPPPEGRASPDRVASSAVRVSEPATTQIATPTLPVSSAVAVPRPQATKLTPWPSRVVAGASGRLVQIGAFGSTPQAKRGWRFMVRAYPAMAHLPAVVRPARNSKGRTFYRFQVGTTSQAHSEVLCQRMEKIGLSCAVVGLPWKPKVER